MSPLVQRSRPGTAARPNPGDQHWIMLLFESLSAGVIALGVGMAAVMVIVGIYVIVVWPLTFWDLTNVGVEKYESWTSTILWSVFGGGTLAGYWCFSGHAFKGKPKRAAVPAGRSRR
jgi:hypothetical protein